MLEIINELQLARVLAAELFFELKQSKELNSKKSVKYRFKNIFRPLKNKFFAILKLTNKQPDQQKFNHHSYEIRVNTSGLKKKKKILHAIPTFSTGGSQQLIVDIIENLSEEYEHFILISRLRGPVGYTGVPIQMLNVYEESGDNKVYEYLKSLQPDLLHIHFWATTENGMDWYWYHVVFQQAFKLNLITIQNCNNPTFPYFDERIKKNVFVSDYAENVFGLNASQNIVIYPGSNFKKFIQTDGYIPSETIGMVYRLEFDKLNEESIEPFIKTIKKRPNTKALIVGGGTMYNMYKKRVEDEGLSSSFEFTGYVPYNELPAYYSKISIFVAPVHNESFGQVTPFAMNMGIPVVGYDTGALHEIIADKSLLAPKGDSDELSNIIVQLLEDKSRIIRISQFNHNRAQALFSLEKMIDSYRSVYQSVLS